MRVDRSPIRPQVLAALSQMPEVTRQVRPVANAIRRDARRLAPKRTRNLSRSLAVERVFDRRTRAVYFIVGWSAKGWYGLMTETGTEDTPAQPHLVPAAVKNGATATRPGDEVLA